MNVFVRTVRVLCLTSAFAACATSAPSGRKPTASNSSTITRAEMEKAPYASLFEVVQSLRARWLQLRGPNTLVNRPAEVQVVVDDMRMGGVDALRALRTDNVVSIAFFDPIAAAQRWGGKHVQGTIFVTTRPDGVP